jgi:hypothetical protein
VYDSDYGFLAYPYPYFPPEYKIYAKLAQGTPYDSESFVEDMRLSMYVLGGEKLLQSMQELLDMNLGYAYSLEEMHTQMMHKKYGLNISRYFSRKFASKVDVWGLGITLYGLYIKALKKKKIKSQRRMESFIKDVVKHMVVFDPCKRYDAKQVYATYKEWVKN